MGFRVEADRGGKGLTERITVVVTLLNDIRVARTLASLLDQTRAPDAVLICDGGSIAPTQEAARPFLSDRRVHWETFPGSVAETRNAAMQWIAAQAAGSGIDPAQDLVVFLDADQIAPRGWLASLTEPISAARADVAGGPTRPDGPARTYSERYIDGFEAWFYERIVSKDATTLPMGNSAWRRSLLEKVGGFDPRLVWGGEDWDLNLRAKAAGARFEFVPAAWVYHDQAHLRGVGKILRRKYRYSVGATVAYLKNGTMSSKAGSAARTSASYPHPLEWANLVVKPIAFARGWWLYRRRFLRATR
ncbi:MAG: glycosyltransferase family 2 protein [Thermoplasmatota archaeon]